MSLRDQVLEVLRQRLVSGELKPGEIYSAQAVAAELGVSGSPVREAMLTLVNQNLVEPVRNRGFRVLPVSESDRAHILELRVCLEVPAMEKVARAWQEDQEQKFRALAERTVAAAEAGNINEFLAVDRQFHLGLLELSGNPRLVALVEELRDHTRLFGLDRLQERGGLVESGQEHVQIMDALVAGDAGLVGELMRAHLGHVLGEWAGSSLE